MLHTRFASASYKQSDTGINKTDTQKDVCLFMSALLIFPGSCPPSIVSTRELNYRVRYGNGWTLSVINTDYEPKY